MTSTNVPGTARSTRRITSRLLLHLFPGSWRARYGDEFGALLDEIRLSPATLFDVLVAALDARVHPDDPARSWPPMTNRL